MVSTNVTALLATYINALHILHAYRVLDGNGHLSVRNPNNASTFFMMRQLAPAMVSGRDDIGEYRISDAEPIDSSQPDAPLEKYIHSETLKRYQDVNVVLHAHAEELVSYSISDVPLRAAIHVAPFLGKEVPLFDIANYYGANDTQDFLVTNQRLGAALAAEFDSASPSYSKGGGRGCGHRDEDRDGGSGGDKQDEDEHGGARRRIDIHDDTHQNGDHHHGGNEHGGGQHDNNYYDDGHRDDEIYHDDEHLHDNHHDDDDYHSSYPRHNLVLMKHHGFTAVATDIKIATYEGIYAATNARIQTGALLLQHAYTGKAAQGDNAIAYLTEQQIEDAWESMKTVIDKPWAAWEREVRVNRLYVNELDQGY